MHEHFQYNGDSLQEDSAGGSPEFQHVGDMESTRRDEPLEVVAGGGVRARRGIVHNRQIIPHFSPQCLGGFRWYMGTDSENTNSVDTVRTRTNGGFAGR
jgi:hypothetical protein